MTEYIGPYELRGKLGSGAMAVVWRAWDPNLEREVAIKEPVRSPAMSDLMASELAGRFVREGKTSAHLSHPGIVTIFAADVFDGRPAIVMELLRGHTLSALIDRSVLQTSAVLSILDQLLDALDYAHTKGVVHRDVKPDNIFVMDDGRVKLTDFGVAHMSRIDGDDDAIIAGTPGYMSPEQSRAEPVDGRADLFSIGALGYEALTGSNPFGATDGLDSHTILYRTTHGPELVFPTNAQVSQEIQQVVLTALARSKDERYRSAMEMRYALRDAGASSLAGAPIALANAVEDAGFQGLPGVTFASTTMGAVKEKMPEKGSMGWVFGAAAAGALVIFISIALLSAPGSSGAGLLFLAVAAAGGAMWAFSRRGTTTEDAFSRELAVLAGATSGAEDSLSVQVSGPYDHTTIIVGLPATIGRSAEAQIVLADDSASRQHATVERRDDGLWIFDLGSRNGTLVDGVAIGGGCRLSENSVVLIGATELRFGEAG